MTTKTESQEVRRLREFGERLAKDGYPTAIIERAAERMGQLEELVISQDQEMQLIGAHISDIQIQLNALTRHSLFKRQAE